MMYYKFFIIYSLSLKLSLQSYSITKKRAQKLELHRANNGPFKSLDDLLQIQNSKWVYKFYESIIHGKKRKNLKKFMSGLVVTPHTESNQKV